HSLRHRYRSPHGLVLWNQHDNHSEYRGCWSGTGWSRKEPVDRTHGTHDGQPLASAVCVAVNNVRASHIWSSVLGMSCPVFSWAPVQRSGGSDNRPRRNMTTQILEGEYRPSSSQWVRDQVDLYERTGGRQGNTLMDTGLPVIILTTRGRQSGTVRKVALMRVEHDGEYAVIGSQGGAPQHPAWVHILRTAPE